jgi:hypothetical protein
MTVLEPVKFRVVKKTAIVASGVAMCVVRKRIYFILGVCILLRE